MSALPDALTPVEKLHKAVAEFLRETSDHPDAYLQTWFLGMGYMHTANDEGAEVNGVSFSRRYATSDDSPFSVYGLAELTLSDFREALTDTEDDEDE